MSVSNVHVLYAVVTPAGIIDQISDFSLDPGIERILQAGDGKVDAEFVATISQAPVINFTTSALKKGLDISGFDAYQITSATDFYFRKVQSGGTRATGSNHIKVTVSDGMLIPRQLQGQQGSVATLSYDVLPISSDGKQAPLTIATSQALGGTPDETEKYTVGPASVNGTLVDGVQSTTVDMAIDEMLLSGDGSAFNTFAAIQERRPEVSVSVLDAAVLDTFTTTETVNSSGPVTTDHLGQIAISSTAKVSFWQVESGGVRKDPTASSHIVVTLNEGRVDVDQQAASNNDPFSPDLMMIGTDDGTNDPITISTSAALPS